MAALCVWGYWHVIIPQSHYFKCPPIALTLSVSSCWILFYSTCSTCNNCWWFTGWGSIFLIRLSSLSKSCSMDDRSSHDRSWLRTTWRVLTIFLFVICNYLYGQNHFLWNSCAFTDRFFSEKLIHWCYSRWNTVNDVITLTLPSQPWRTLSVR